MSRETTDAPALRRFVIVAVVTLPLCAWAGCSGDTKIVYVEVPAEAGTLDAGALDAGGAAEDGSGALDAGASDAESEDAAADAALPVGWCGNATGFESESCQYTSYYSCSCGGSAGSAGFVAVCPQDSGRPATDGCEFDVPDAIGDRWCCPARCIRLPNGDVPACGGAKLYSCASFSDGAVAATLPSIDCEAGPPQTASTNFCCP
jgi:hypothetical protein